jgi:hypothetical protein
VPTSAVAQTTAVSASQARVTFPATTGTVASTGC